MSNAEIIEALPLAAPAGPGAVARILANIGRGFVTHVLPPLVIIALLLVIWQALGSRPGAALPSPSKVVQDTWELITHPFYDHGGNDVGIAWQLLASLKRVAYGYSLAVPSEWEERQEKNDTITFTGEVVAKRRSKSRPGWGILTLSTRGANQKSEPVFAVTSHLFVATEEGEAGLLTDRA